MYSSRESNSASNRCCLKTQHVNPLRDGISFTQNYYRSWLAGKGRKEDSNESRSRLNHTILLSRCYFAIARPKRGNIVEPGWFLWHRKENPWGSMKMIILSNEVPRASFEKHFLLLIPRDLRCIFSPLPSRFYYANTATSTRTLWTYFQFAVTF